MITMNKSLIIIIILIITINVADAVTNDGEHSNVRTGEWDILHLPAWNALQSYWGESSGDTVPGMFGYSIQRWEVEACSAGITLDLDPQGTGGVVNPEALQQGVYADTATISVSRELFTFNESLYTISWYLQPKNDPIKYQVFLKDVDDEVYEYPESTADPIQGEAGYDAFYASRNFTIAYIKNLDSKEIILQVKVVDVKAPRIR